MHSSLQCRLLPLHRSCLKRGTYGVAGRRRLPRTACKFHTSHICESAPQDPPSSADPSLNNSASTEHEFKPEGGEKEARIGGNVEKKRPSLEKSTTRDSSPYGSATRRARRNVRLREQVSAPAAVVPEWLYERNLLVRDSAPETTQFAKHGLGIKEGSQEVEEDSSALAEGGEGGDGTGPENPSSPDHRYLLSQAIWDELNASVKAGLKLPTSRYANEPSATKAHLVLQYPGDGGILFLDAIVKRLATSLNVDLLTLNAQDIAELYDEQGHGDTTTSAISGMGYEVYQASKTFSPKEVEEDVEEGEEEEGVEDDDADSMPIRASERDSVFTKSIPIAGGNLNPSSVLQGLFGGKGSMGVAKVFVPREERDEVESREELRCLRLLNELLSSPNKRRDQNVAVVETNGSESAPEETKSETPRPDLIVQIQDYKDMQNSRSGSIFIPLLHKAVQARRREGQRVMIVGTVSGKRPEYPLGKAYPRLVQRDSNDEFARTIVVTPAMKSSTVEHIFAEDMKRRVFDINVRHLRNMLRTRVQESSTSDNGSVYQDWPIDPEGLKNSGLDDGYWSFDRVHRVVTLALGCAEDAGQLGFGQIQHGIDLVEKSDRVKSDWMAEKYPKAKASRSEPDREGRLKQLRKTCNSHEKKLLNGVVDADSIRTTFDDVHAEKGTVEALKTLTSLSLIRPDAFTYGVLSTDKIPGLLLYGPPGTGKTLLAKAVARQSGATVLEVSGSEVYDMYVGEGEKNVKAIFTLAKKLSPCVVFIDEADAIFCSRVGASTRTSHRELINQFLREWDGMNELSAFIMVATNRPFDLDDAVLRRLPRRLLVDLPTEQDRLSILKIHLKEEALDSTVDLAELASKTPLYSGSDLKNMCVAAALACVREENDKAAQHTGEEPYKHPERRTLTRVHFENAMEEISASISEDMSSLAAIKKFDEKYGDRKGRRKKGSGWGFSSPGDAAAVTETGRVRN